MIAEKNKVVSMSYTLRLNGKDGDVVEVVEASNPFNFIYGNGHLLEKFEENISGLSVDDKFEFMLTSDEAYGSRNEENIADIPMSAFMVEGKIDEDLLKIGNYIPLRDEAGNHYNGKVVSVSEEAVKLDFNHPLAGEDLYFTGQILNIREATAQELEHGHVHHDGHDH